MPASDLIVVGGGVAGLYAALEAAALGAQVTLLSAGPLLGGSTSWAQGGIAAPLGKHDEVAHAADTLAAGRGLCEGGAVQTFVAEARGHVERLREWGVPFAADLVQEGGHCVPRIWHAYGDATGRAVSETLAARVRAQPNITVREGAKVTRLLLAGEQVAGVELAPSAEAGPRLTASAVLLATGGYGRLFPVGTAPPDITGSGLLLAALAGATLRDLEFMQFHPTAVVQGGQAYLVSEAVRGAGGRLLNGLGQRFMPALDPQAELAPRDVVARAIHAQRQETGRVWLDISHLGRAEVQRRFPNITARLSRLGLDLAGGPVEVQPAAHYSVGGIQTDLQGWTGVPGLYAAGEAASVGLHGANRLASNSLSEGLVFGARAARQALAGAAFPLPADGVTAGLAAGPQDSWAQWQPRFAAAAGLVRCGSELQAALEGWPRVRAAQATAAGAEQLLLAQGFLQAALARCETRGTHARRDFPGQQPPSHFQLRLHLTGSGYNWTHQFTPLQSPSSYLAFQESSS